MDSVDERENHSYWALGLTLLAMALILWLLPYVLVVPVILLLLAGGVSTTIYAWRQRQQLNQNKSNSPDLNL